MEERRRMRARQRRPQGTLDRLHTTVVNDVALAARLAGSGAGVVGAGLAAGLVLDFAGGAGQVAWLGWGVFGAGLLLGLLLVTLLIANRRNPREGRRAPLRAYVALALLGGAVIAAATRLARPAPPLAILLGGVLTLAAVALGVWAMRRVERAVLRVAVARRHEWYAQIRASRLTRRMLGYAAYRQLRRDGSLPIKSGVHPGRTYLVPIRTTPSGARILVLEGDRPIGGLCLRPRQPLPDPEEALTHILAIRTDERAWLNRANFFPQDRALTPQALGLAPGRPGNYER